ncbi:MAG TPA: pyridoxal phosphate-dependent aminotransferase [Candidatus Acidoferrales bacterium]|nr:pyridoxal phosphate-dependent aminotransferase [Candidatus Acidoferrales bacterium]
MFADRTNWNLEENRLTRALTRRRAAGDAVLDLSASNPTTCGFSFDENVILRALADPAALRYSPDPHGLPAARAAVCDYYAQLGAAISPEEIFLTTGTSEAYSFIFRTLCNPGDEILIPTPGYPLFDFLADIHDVRLVRYSLLYDHGWQIDFYSVERAIGPRTRAAIVVHPNNPTGHYAKAAEAAQLGNICARHGMALIGDEVFYDFSYSQERPPSFIANQDALTFVLSGLSKICGLPQMKAGWIATTGPGDAKQSALARLEVIADTYLSMNAPVQSALPTLLGLRHDLQRQLMARTTRNLAELDAQLASHPRCSRLEVEGGWNAVLRVPAIRPDEDAAIDLLESRGVYVHPGHFYDFPDDGHMVVSLIAPIDDFAEGISRVLKFF